MAKLSVAVLFVTMGLLTAGISGAVSAAEPAPAREIDKPEHVCVHDPSIFADTDGTFYLLGSHTASASSGITSTLMSSAGITASSAIALIGIQVSTMSTDIMSAVNRLNLARNARWSLRFPIRSF